MMLTKDLKFSLAGEKKRAGGINNLKKTTF